MTSTPTAEPRLSTEPELLMSCADDFGHVVHRTPRAIAPVASAAEVTAAVRYARKQGLAMVPRGTGHSTAGQSQVEDGLVVDLRSLNEIGAPIGIEITVGAGATWHSVVQATLPHGLAPPVLTDYIDISVGGTLSVGGISGATHRHGLQTDNVVALDVVTPDGTLVRCSPDTNRDVFDAVRAGRGRRGIITSATLKLVPAPSRTRLHHAYYSDLDTFLRDQLTLMRSETADYVEGHARPTDDGRWQYRIEAAYHYEPCSPPDDGTLRSAAHDEIETTELSYWDFANRLAEGERLLRENGHWTSPHVWANYLLPQTQSATVIEKIMSMLTPDDISESGTVIIYPFSSSSTRTPGFPLPAAGDITTLFAILRTLPPTTTTTAKTASDANDRFTRIVTEAGGTAYLDPLRAPTSGAESDRAANGHRS